MTLTLTDLDLFLDAHGNPDVVIVDPQDFVMIASFASAKVEANTCWLFGTKFIRRSGSTIELDWSDKRIPKMWEKK